MAEQIGNWIFKPNFQSFIDRIAIDAIKRAVKQIAQEAHDLVMSQWSGGVGYNANGSLSPWKPNKRKNPTLIDTGILKSSLNIVFLDGGFDYMFEISGPSDYVSGASVEEVSEYNSDRPHKNIPKEYMSDPPGSRAKNIIEKEVFSEYKTMRTDGTIIRAR